MDRRRRPVERGREGLAATHRAPSSGADRRDDRSRAVNVTVDPGAATPPYEQLRAQIARLVGSGQLEPGARLPTIQQLANDLALAPGTVARAYKELERDGVVVSKRRTGTTVAAAPPRVPAREIRQELDAAAQRFALEVRQLGADPDEALGRVQRLLGA
jgi:DNA-binding transcriptional regulator YhcF (GntR family)